MTPAKVWPPERAAEIRAVKEGLRAAERLRALGVSLHRLAWRWSPGFDSWEVDASLKVKLASGGEVAASKPRT